MKIYSFPIEIYLKLIKRHKKGVSFVILSFFLITFSLSRLWVYLAIRNIVPESFTDNINGVHVHHFAYGILLTAFIGYLALTLPHEYLQKWKIKLAVIFGIGLGWTFDEFGMWMRLRDDYWVRQSYDAVVVISIIFINIVYLADFWQKLIKKLVPRSIK